MDGFHRRRAWRQGPRRHRPVGRIAGVLFVHHLRHALQSLAHLRLAADTVMQPVGDVLAGNPQGRTVLHQADVVDVRDLRAADPLVDPAHHVAEDALTVVVELLLDLVGAPGGLGIDRHGQQVIEQVDFTLFLQVALVQLVMGGYIVSRLFQRSSLSTEEKTDYDYASTAQVGSVITPEPRHSSPW